MAAASGQGAQAAALAGLALLGTLAGAAVAVAGVNALTLCVSLIGCAFILRDFRFGVALLIVLMPVSRSSVFPHAMLGITGLNPFNLLLAATLGSYLLRALGEGARQRFVPRPLFWLYLVPLLVAGALGTRHLGDIAPLFYMHDMLDFHGVGGYLREYLLKPLLIVLYALLVAAAVARSRDPEAFLVPTLLSIWGMGTMVIVFVLLSGVGLERLSQAEWRGTLSALGLHANDLGRLYAVAYALLLFAWAEAKGRTRLRLALVASMALVVAALLLTFSRGAFFGFLLVNLLFLLWRRNLKTLLLASALAAAALLALPSAVYERIGLGFDAGPNAISAGRLDGLWLPLLPEVLNSPLYGSGLGSILWSAPMRAMGGAGVTGVLGATHPHNAYLEALLDLGILGLALLCAYFHHVWKGFRALGADPALSPALRGFYQGAAAGLAAFLIAGLTDSSLAPKAEQAFLWLAIGMMYGQRSKKPAA